MTQHSNNKFLCRICNSEAQLAFKNKILSKYLISYYKCSNCGFLQTETPFWLNEAYLESINLCDTGILRRNSVLSNFISILLFFYFPRKGKYLDYAGGYGLLTRAMRDIGFDFFWEDPYTPNILAKGFEKKENNYDLISTIESFEHFENPLNQIEKMLSLSNNIFFTTQLLPYEIPQPDKWDYYAFSHGQHISFYSIKTLQFIAKRYKLNLYSDGKFFHLLSPKKFSYNIVLSSKVLYGLQAHFFIKKLIKSKTLQDSQILIDQTNPSSFSTIQV